MSVYRDKDTGRFRYDFWFHAVRYVAAGFKSADAAKRAEDRRRRDAELGVMKSYRTLSALVVAFLEAGERTKSAWHLYCCRTEIARVFGDLYSIAPTRITAAHIEPLLARYAKRHKPNTVNSARGKLNAVLNHGVKVGALAFNPMRAVDAQPADDDAVVDPIPTPHLQQLVLAAPPYFAAKLTFIAQTGCRWREHARLRWEEVYLDGPEPFAILTTRKNRGGRVRKTPQPLSRPAVAAVERMRGADAVYVFPGPKGGVSRYTTDYQRLLRFCRAAGIPDYGFHQLRHWTGLMATSMGKSKKAVADYLRHTSTSATERYMHSLKPELWEVAQRLEDEWNGMIPRGIPAGVQSVSGRSRASRKVPE